MTYLLRLDDLREQLAERIQALFSGEYPLGYLELDLGLLFEVSV